MRRFVPALLATLLCAPQIAAAAESPCLTPGEFTALSTYALPGIIGGTARACAPVLGENAYLRRSGSELAQRYALAKPRAWPGAKAAFLKMSAARDPNAAQLFAAMPDDSLQTIADAAIAGTITGQVKPDSCKTIDRAVALLAPLPPENTAELIALAIGLGAKAGPSRLGSLSICKA